MCAIKRVCMIHAIQLGNSMNHRRYFENIFMAQSKTLFPHTFYLLGVVWLLDLSQFIWRKRFHLFSMYSIHFVCVPKRLKKWTRLVLKHESYQFEDFQENWTNCFNGHHFCSLINLLQSVYFSQPNKANELARNIHQISFHFQLRNCIQMESHEIRRSRLFKCIEKWARFSKPMNSLLWTITILQWVLYRKKFTINANWKHFCPKTMVFMYWMA